MSVDTTPATYTPGEKLAAAKLNTEVRDFAAGVQSTWDIYVPTVTGTTNPSIGNGVLTGRYLRLGKTIICTIVMQMGSTTTYGSGTWTITLPVASVWASQTDVSMGSAHLFDTSATARKTGQVFNVGQSTVRIVTDSATLVGTAVPWTWATGDVLSLDLVYEAN